MLIGFTVGNFRSIKSPVTFSMVAGKIVSKNKAIDQSNLFQYKEGVKLLKTAAIYGANASGKSNLFRAIVFFKNFVKNSSKETQAEENIPVESFKLSTTTEKRPSFFEMVFDIGGSIFRYGFEVDQKTIHSEWLFRTKERETVLFKREFQKISVRGGFPEGEGLEEKTRENTLFLSACAQWNGLISREIIKWFDNLAVISGLDDFLCRRFTERQLENPETKGKILGLIREFDLGISDLAFKKNVITSTSLPKNMPKEIKELILSNKSENTSVRTTHLKLNEDDEVVGKVIFDLDENESEGTRKAFSLSGPLMDVFERGMVLVIDEFDARMHPIISKAIVQMFHDETRNPKNAQLIFVTHDTNLLDNSFFRRDQIWFTEKRKNSATDLFSLVDFKVRNDASFEKDYISGKYGGIPFLGWVNRVDVEGMNENE